MMRVWIEHVVLAFIFRITKQHPYEDNNIPGHMPNSSLIGPAYDLQVIEECY